MIIKKLSLLLLLIGTLSACQNAKQLDTNPELENLYSTIEESSAQYKSALNIGDDPGAQQALLKLMETGNKCSATDGCEAKRFVHLYAEIMDQQASRLNIQNKELGEDFSDAGESDEEGQSPMLANLHAASQSVSLLHGKELRDMIAVNGPVKAALNEWLTWKRSTLMDTYENYQFLRHQMWPAYEQAGLPEALLFGILANESNAKVHAVSHSGAAGPLQFMPATGRRFGLGVDVTGFDTRFDPQPATKANALYLEERFRQFNHDLALSLAAYNGGEARVGRLVSKAGKLDFWDPAVYSGLPSETREYVPMVLAAAWLFLHPEDYGLQFPIVNNAVTQLKLAQPSSLNALAICLGNQDNRNGWFRTLRNLNPRFTAHEILEEGTMLQVSSKIPALYTASCIQGPIATNAMEVAEAAIQQPVVKARVTVIPEFYAVKSGDTLAAISQRFSCRGPQQLAKTNNIAAPKYMLRPGQRLRLDGCKKIV